MAPPQSSTSPAATRLAAPLPKPVVYSTPTARVPWKTIFVTKARVSTFRLGRCITGCRYARAADRRRPLRMLRSNGAKPSWR